MYKRQALNDIPSGRVAISLSIKTLASGLSDKLQAGDIVRIYHFLETAREIPELRFVRVLSVTSAEMCIRDRVQTADREAAPDPVKLAADIITSDKDSILS